MTNEEKYIRLNAMANWTRIDQVAKAVACEFSAEDNTPTLHLNLWRGVDLFNMPPAYSSLKVAAEGNWDGGRAYSLQFA